MFLEKDFADEPLNKDLERQIQNDTDGIIIPNTPKIHFPLVVFNEDFFYSSEGFDRVAFNSWVRENGWSRPVNVLLILTLSLWIGGFFGYYLFLNKYWTGVKKIVSDIIMGSSCAVQSFSMLYTISADVQDNSVIVAKKPRNVNYIKVSGIPVIDPDTMFCHICQVTVCAKSKHCKNCNKCVAVYDHHCAFLSTCVAEKNYKYFIMTIVLASLLSWYEAILSVLGICLFLKERNEFASNYFNGEDLNQYGTYYYIIGLGLFGLIYMSVGSGLGFLSIFHFRLMYVGLTTVQYYEDLSNRGPSLWSIDAARYKANMAKAARFRNLPEEERDITSL